MSRKPQAPYSTSVNLEASSVDLEATADYPPLVPAPPVGPADTWVLPQLAEAPVMDDLLRAHQEEIATLRQSVAVVTTSRDQLRADLTDLTGKLSDLEQLLHARNTQHAQHERELRAHQEEIGTLRQGLAAVTASRDQLQTNLTALAVKLQDVEQVSRENREQRSQQERELRAHQDEVGTLSQSLAAVTASRDQLQANLSALTAKLHDVEQVPREDREQHSRQKRELRAHQQEIDTLRQSLAAVTASRDQLQANLSALTAKLHDVEQVPREDREQHSRQKRELRAHQQEIDTLRQSLAAVTASRDQLQANLTAQTTKRHDSEQVPRETHEQHLQLERELDERDRRLAELTQEQAARAEQLRLDDAERDELRARLKRAEANLTGLTQLRERQANVQIEAERERARREAALARSHDELTDLQRRVAGYREALHRAEARRQVFDAMLREREQMLDERDARLRALRDDLDAQRREHGAALERATAETAAAVARASEAERRLAAQLQRTQARDAETTASGAVAPRSDPDSKLRIAALESQLADLHETERTLLEQLQAAQGANEALRANLAAAELQIGSAASELQHGNARLAQPEANTPAPTPLARERTRLLVRTEGDAGIVHVLGRRTTIGRTPDNDLRIEAEFISRHHAVVLVTDGGTVVEDLNSTNGVYVNDTRVLRHELREGDRVTIGNTSFRYVLKPLAGQD